MQHEEDDGGDEKRFERRDARGNRRPRADRIPGRQSPGSRDRWTQACRGIRRKYRQAPGLAGTARPDACRNADRALADAADIVVECAPSRLVRSIVAPVVSRGKTAVVLSVGALLENEDLIGLAKAHGGQIVVPTGALIGLDAMTVAAEGTIHSVRMITRKPVRGLIGAPYLVQHKIEIEGISKPLKIFEGTAREAARGFPADLNVAVALSLAGIGPDRTMVEIWADTTVTRNTHRIEVDSDSARFSMVIENIPSENPKTGLITALSVIACLRKLRAPLRIGT